LKDSIYSNTTAENLARFSAEFDTEQLRSEKDEERQAKRRAVIIGIGTTLLLALLTVAVWYAMRRRNRRQNEINLQLSADIQELREKYKQLQLHYDKALVTKPDETDNPEGIGPAEQEFMEHVVNIINEQINIGQADAACVAERLNMSPFQFRQRLTALTGVTPQSFIQIVRMRRARYLLDNNPELNITQIANLCGYNDTPNFTRAFKKSVGITPSQYQEKQSNCTN
jgi:AraC-like DNA-binding protein